MKRCKDWDREISSWKYLATKRNAPPVSRSTGCLTLQPEFPSGSVEGLQLQQQRGSVSAEADGKCSCFCSVAGKCSCQVLICSCQSEWCYLTSSSSDALFSFCLPSFQWVGSFHQVDKVLVLQLQRHSFQWLFRVDSLQDCLLWSPCCPRDSQESSPAPQFKSINSLVFSLLHGPTLTSVCDCRKKHSFDCMDLCQKSYISAF